MANKKKKKDFLPKDVLSSDEKRKDYTIAGSAVWHEANPDKSKTYGRKEFKGKKVLTFNEAEIFLETSGNWLTYFMRGENGFPKLPYSWDGNNVATVKFAREDLVKYRTMLQERKSSTKTRPQRK